MIDLEKPTATPETEPAHAPDNPSVIPPFELQPDAPLRDARRYEIDELLRLHDRQFVTQAFQAIRKREPDDAEFHRTLDDLRSGRRTKAEIIGQLMTDASTSNQPVEISGFTAPALQSISRWPVVGYLARLFAAIVRLPRFIKDQQQFETYAIGQQQRMADYLNEVMAPAFTRYEENSPAIANLSVTMADLIDTVTMLSDSLIEMTARQTEFQTVFQGQLEKLQTSQAEYAQNLAAETRTRWEQTQMQFEQIQAQMAQVQGDLKQHAGTLQQLHADLMSVAASQTSQQKAIEELQTVVEETRRAHRLTADAQQEFLIQEQRVIVETQKVVLGDLQAQIDDLLAQQKLKNEELATAVQNLRTMVETKSKAAGRRPSPIETA